MDNVDNMLCKFAAVIFSVLVSLSQQSYNEEKLLRELRVNRQIDPLVRPVEDDGQTMNVTLDVVLRQIVKVDEVNEAFHVNMYQIIVRNILLFLGVGLHALLRETWRDYKLSWNASEFGGIDVVRLLPSSIWKPDVVIYNRIDMDDSAVREGLVAVQSDGKCMWAPLGVYAAHCPINIKWFPFDYQLCSLYFESWTMNVAKLNLTHRNRGISLKHYKGNSQWELTDTSADRIIVEYEEGNYSVLRFDVHLKRKTLFYGFNLILPCILISMLAVGSFHLPAESGERLGLSVSILLALSVYQLIILDKIPASGESVPFLGVYFGSVTILCIVIILMTIITVNLQHRSPPFYRVPKWVRIWICGRLARLLRMRMDASKKSNSGVDTTNCKLVTSDSNMLMPNQQVLLDTDSRPTADPVALALLQKMMEKNDEDEVDKMEVDQWKFATLVIDRFCLGVFSVYWVVGTVGIFLTVPLIDRFKPSSNGTV